MLPFSDISCVFTGFGNQGLQWPWESAFTGFDCCTGGPDGPNKEGRYELHISGDIAFAVQQYWQATSKKCIVHTSDESHSALTYRRHAMAC